jgi:hypothetical protein
MQCSLYSFDGPVMSEGSCEMEGNAITMTTSKWHMTPQEGSQPLTLMMDGGRHCLVRVDRVHVLESNPSTGPREQYLLTQVDEDAKVTVGAPPGVQATPGMEPADRRSLPHES